MGETTSAPSTVALFPQGVSACEATVVLAEAAGDDGPFVIVTDRTPFHPLDHTWPDQPGDRGTLTLGGREHAVVDAVTMAAGPDGTLYRAEAIPARRTDPGWSFLVGHVLETPPDGDPADLAGEQAGLAVDVARRSSLSAAHTACHLMSLALNMELRDLWRKVPRTDCLGSPDFDQTAITRSSITPGRALTGTASASRSARRASTPKPSPGGSTRCARASRPGWRSGSPAAGGSRSTPTGPGSTPAAGGAASCPRVTPGSPAAAPTWAISASWPRSTCG